MKKEELISLVNRYQTAKDNGQLQNASEATMRTWIDELLSLFDWNVQNTQQVLTEHSLGRAERARLHEIGSREASVLNVALLIRPSFSVETLMSLPSMLARCTSSCVRSSIFS